MDREKLKEDFIKKSREKFGDIFDYSKVEYVDAHTKICIEKNGVICWTTPDSHLHTKYGGAAFNPYKQSLGEMMTFSEFIKIASEKYEGRFKYECEDWVGIVKSKVVLYCPIHGKQIINPRSHINKTNKYGCPVCAAEKRVENRTHDYKKCLEQFKELYGNKYIYPEENESLYINKKSRIKIICPEHGVFYKTAQKHLSGQGCHKCRIEELKRLDLLPGGYNEELFKEKPFLKNEPALLYYLCNEDASLFKIGITRVSVKKRIGSLIQKAKSNNENIKLFEIASKKMTLYEAFVEEQKILAKYKDYRCYTSWTTELFTKDIFEDIKYLFI